MDEFMSDPNYPIEAVGANQLHDLKNRLTVVKGVAQLLDRQIQRDDWERDKIVLRVRMLQDEIALVEQLLAGYDDDEVGSNVESRHSLPH